MFDRAKDVRRTGFTSPDGLSFLSKIGEANGWKTGQAAVTKFGMSSTSWQNYGQPTRWTANKKTTESFRPGEGHVRLTIKKRNK